MTTVSCIWVLTRCNRFQGPGQSPRLRLRLLCEFLFEFDQQTLIGWGQDLLFQFIVRGTAKSCSGLFRVAKSQVSCCQMEEESGIGCRVPSRRFQAALRFIESFQLK